MTASVFMNLFGFLLLALSAVMVLSAAQPICDPLTQYEDKTNQKCCMKCKPGTKMLDKNCDAPRCEPCAKYEYREKYTNEDKCELQEYCDPNKNFETPDHDPKKKTVCMCKQGFHCSSKTCITCVPHKLCGPGEGVLYEGNHTHDTGCQKCAEGTFSNETSLTARCVDHTKCPVGFITEVAGTDQSDTVCVKSRVHITVGIVVGIVTVAVIIGVLVGLYRRGKWSLKNKKKTPIVCVECIGPKGETPIKTEDESTIPMMLPQTPVENEDSSIPSTSSEEHGRSENGKIVCPVEEEGKMARLPRQESQVSASSTVSFS